MGTFEDLVERQCAGKTPGAAVAVTRSGERVAEVLFGHADLEWQQPVTPDTVFRLASVSKPFTALTVVLLARDGAIDLDAPITDCLPELKDRGNVTARHLLTHTSGIANFVTRPGFLTEMARRDVDDEEMLAHLGTMPSHFEPGTRYSYSNSGYRLLDLMIARITGRPYAEVLRERVLDPAGMVNSLVIGDREVIRHRARGYQKGPHGFLNSEYASMTIPGGAGGLGSTLEDLLRFDRALATGVYGDVDMVFAPVALTSGRSEGYGLGWAINTYRERTAHHHAGGIAGFSTMYVRVPSDDTCVVVLTNMEGFDCAGLAQTLLDEALTLPAPSYAGAGPETAGQRAGVYSDPLGRVEVTSDRSEVVITGDAGPTRFRPVGGDLYVSVGQPDTTLRFHTDESALTITYPLFWQTFYREDGGENR